jgi:hypothetical protein
VPIEHERLLPLHLGKWKGCVATSIHDCTIGLLFKQKWLLQHHNDVLTISINQVSTTFGVPFSDLAGLWGNI